MDRKNKQFLTFFGAAVGAGLAAYGINRGLKWYRARQQVLLNEGQTGYLPGQRPYEREGQQRFAQTGQAFTDEQRQGGGHVGETQHREVGERLQAGQSTMRGDTEWPEQRRYQPVDQPDVEAIPTTGAAPAATEADTMAFANTSNTGFVMDEYVAPLIEHAIAFNSVINLLRSRQRDGVGNEGTESLTAGDRNSMRAVLDQMQEREKIHDESELSGQPLALRAHRLTNKMREALDNLDYTGSDLFRIYGEIKNELCKLASELDKTGQVTITGLDHIRQLYECA